MLRNWIHLIWNKVGLILFSDVFMIILCKTIKARFETDRSTIIIPCHLFDLTANNKRKTLFSARPTPKIISYRLTNMSQCQNNGASRNLCVFSVINSKCKQHLRRPKKGYIYLSDVNNIIVDLIVLNWQIVCFLTLMTMIDDSRRIHEYYINCQGQIHLTLQWRKKK
jgi:hypothetical protein